MTIEKNEGRSYEDLLNEGDEEAAERYLKNVNDLMMMPDPSTMEGTEEEKALALQKTQVAARYLTLLVDREARDRLAAEQFANDFDSEDLARHVRRGRDVLQHVEIPWLIAGRLHEVGIGQVSAAPYEGKTLLALDLALSVANGLPAWQGYAINRTGLVVYIAAEGGPAIQIHIDAWLKAHPGTDPDNLILVDELPVDWTSVHSVTRLVDGVLSTMVDGVDQKPVLWIGDTQIDLIGATDENSADLGKVLAKMREFAVESEAFLLLLHHQGYEGTRGRGSSSQGGKLDVIATMAASKMDFETKDLAWPKIKGAARPQQVDRLRIRPVAGSTGAVIEPVGAVGLGDGPIVADAAARLVEAQQAIVDGLWDEGAFVSKNHIHEHYSDRRKADTLAMVDSLVIDGVIGRKPGRRSGSYLYGPLEGPKPDLLRSMRPIEAPEPSGADATVGQPEGQAEAAPEPINGAGDPS